MPKNKKYKTGYKKPPEKHQFKTGKSGNPNGRPKGSKNITTLIEQELNEKLVINQNGKRIMLTKIEAIAKAIVNGAMLMDAKAIRALLPILGRIEEEDVANNASLKDKKMQSDDLEILKRFIDIEGEDDGNDK